ncbi:MAG: hypothetical protein U0166_21180 [Acidobacteriota bacterium]
MRILLSFVITILLLASAVAGADPRVEVYNLTIGTNKFITMPERISRCEVAGAEFVRVKCEENGNNIELFPVSNGKTRIFVYEPLEGRLAVEVRVNVCTKDVIALYEQYAAMYRSVEGLVIDIDSNKVTFSGTVFSLQAFKEIGDMAAAKGFNASGLKLHPYVNAVLGASPSALGPPPAAPAADGAKATTP